MTTEIWSMLGFNALLLLLAFSLVSIPSLRTGDPSYVDGVWGLGFLAVAVSTTLQTSGDPARTTALVGLTAVWSLRLSGYLFLRWHRSGPDPRYQAMLARSTGRQSTFLWSRVFLTQGLLVAIVSLPLQLGQVYDHPRGLTALNIAGIVLAGFGIAFESLADLQLARFRAARTRRDQVLDTGLWRYSRHPNYFGEACTWWGLLLVAVVNVPTAAAAVGPLVLTGFLLKWSGVGHLERTLTQSKPGYRDYITRTSAFLPAPPKPARVRSDA